MTNEALIQSLSGALTLAFGLASWHFLRFWRKTGDRLFVHFAVAFALFAANQIATSFVDLSDERRGYAYILRILGYVLILTAIVDKNVFRSKWRG